MRVKTAIIFAILFFSHISVSSQVRSISVISDAKKKGTNQSTRLVLSRPKVYPKTKKTDEQQDFILYRDIIRKYTWYEGLGEPISQETANHLPYYFKLTMKNEHGHWQHIQAMHQGKMTPNHNQTTYVLDKRNASDKKNEDWVKKIKSVCQWFLTSDLSGKNVVEERAYTAERDLVYSFMPIKNSDGRITGSYNDAWGLPADMREDDISTYGSVVCITYDKCGRDSIVDFLDGQGLRKYNSNGVDQQRYIYDNKDRIVLVTSHNMVGDYATDNWGNCGNRYIYDDNDNKYSIIRVNRDLKPMRMPSLRADATRTFIRCDIKKDRWGRDVEAIMLNEKGEKDSTNSGISRIKYNYDERGNLVSTKYYDMSDNEIKFISNE